jgi:F-type H+-transporting ATPase subunit b
MQEASFLNDTTFWYAVALVLFALLFWKTGWRPLMGVLDGEIVKVRAELDEAKRLRAEAEATLRDYRARERDAAKEAESIVSQAKDDAARLREEAERDLALMLDRHEKIALDRIKLAQEDALAEVRAYVLEEALSEARGKLNKMAQAGETAALTDKIIDDLPKLKNA